MAVVARAATVSGRVIDGNGKPQTGKRVGVQLHSGPIHSSSAHLVLVVLTDEQGKFRYEGAPVGSEGEFSMTHMKDGRGTGARTVIEFGVHDANPIEVPDLVVPPAGSAGEAAPQQAADGKVNP